MKLSMYFRGREMAHIDLGKKILERYSQDLADLGEIEKDSGLEGRMIVVLLNPKPNTKKKPTGKVEQNQNAKTENE